MDTARDEGAGTNPGDTGDALARYDDNRSGRKREEALRHGIAPVRRGHPAYRCVRDGDGDGIVCESERVCEC